MALYEHIHARSARKYFIGCTDGPFEAVRSRLQPMIEMVRMLNGDLKILSRTSATTSPTPAANRSTLRSNG
jgi:hypothetical protein